MYIISFKCYIYINKYFNMYSPQNLFLNLTGK